MSTYIIYLISHLTLRKIGLTRIKTLSPPMSLTLLIRAQRRSSDGAREPDARALPTVRLVTSRRLPADRPLVAYRPLPARRLLRRRHPHPRQHYTTTWLPTSVTLCSLYCITTTTRINVRSDCLEIRVQYNCTRMVCRLLVSSRGIVIAIYFYLSMVLTAD